MELRQKIPRGLRRRQLVPEQQRQRLVLPELIEILGPLATRCPYRQQALHHLRRAQPAPAALQLDLAVDHRRRPGLTKRLDQSGNPRMPRDQPGFQLDIDREIQPLHHPLPRTAPVKLTIPPEQKRNQQLPRKFSRIPNR